MTVRQGRGIPFSWNTSVEQTTTKSYDDHIMSISMSCMNHTYDSYIKTYKLWVWQSAPRTHLLVAASVTLTRTLFINKRATRGSPSACKKLSNAAQVRQVCSSECFQGCFSFFKFTLIIPVDYSNEFFPSDRYSDLPNLTFIIFEKYFPFLKVWLIINISHSLW